jgi:hypothetical protein
MQEGVVHLNERIAGLNTYGVGHVARCILILYPASSCMSRAIGFAIALVTVAVFLPDVFRSVEALLLKSLVLANTALDSLAAGGHLVQ